MADVPRFERQNASQTYQFTAESAGELLDVLRKAFPEIC
jgi:hypothetical protein